MISYPYSYSSGTGTSGSGVGQGNFAVSNATLGPLDTSSAYLGSFIDPEAGSIGSFDTGGDEFSFDSGLETNDE